jgi:hypothetical protein
MFGIAFAFILSLFVIGNASALTNIDSCQTLSTENETYVMNASVNSSGDCFTISAKNITLDCNNYLITGGGATYRAVYNGGQTYFTMRNCKITNVEWGYYADGGNYAQILNNDIYSYNGDNTAGIAIFYAQNVSVNNNYIHDTLSSYGYGINAYGLKNSNISSNRFSSMYLPFRMLDNTNYVTMFNNTMIDDYNAIYFSYSDNNIIDCNGNPINGQYVYYLGTYGIETFHTHGIKVYNCNITGFAYGINPTNDADVIVYNTTTSANLYDLQVLDANADLYNTSTSTLLVTSSGNINIYWLLNIINPLNANVTIYNSQNVSVAFFNSSNSTWVKQLYQNLSDIINYTPYNLVMNKSGYYSKIDSINMNTNNVYTISMSPITIPVIDPSSITGQLVITLGFGIMGIIAVLSLLGFTYVTSAGKPDTDTFIKVFIAIVIIIIMIVGVWQGIVLPP